MVFFGISLLPVLCYPSSIFRLQLTKLLGRRRKRWWWQWTTFSLWLTKVQCWAVRYSTVQYNTPPVPEQHRVSLLPLFSFYLQLAAVSSCQAYLGKNLSASYSLFMEKKYPKFYIKCISFRQKLFVRAFSVWYLQMFCRCHRDRVVSNSAGRFVERRSITVSHFYVLCTVVLDLGLVILICWLALPCISLWHAKPALHHSTHSFPRRLMSIHAMQKTWLVFQQSNKLNWTVAWLLIRSN